MTVRLYKIDSHNVHYQAMLVHINTSLGNLLKIKQEYTLAQSHFNKALKIINVLTKHNSDNTEWLANKVSLINSIGNLLRKQKAF